MKERNRTGSVIERKKKKKKKAMSDGMQSRGGWK